ncbi:Uncharacterised protein [Serratia fonticola]|uniref:helix-turn-helix transcriptional regulator n=1 Tax=Serratia fonticola TaxID=47917 RepID=UPI0021841A02|nr:WYL domain-containing protein [Serratia fonticola]CAI2078304.1 Uncharacterised protein [Serratia fonticola]
MSAQERRHDRLAYRLASIISRLFNGESLSVAALAREFNVSLRTLDRDFNTRLVGLDMDHREGCYRLADSQRPFRTDRDIIQFASITDVKQFFPALDRKLLSVLLNRELDSPYIVYNAPPKRLPSLFGGFYAITQAIVENRIIRFVYEGLKHSAAEPYKLIYFAGDWYLCVAINNIIQVFDMHHLSDITLTISTFVKKEAINTIISEEKFITALPHFQYIKALTASESGQ